MFFCASCGFILTHITKIESSYHQNHSQKLAEVFSNVVWWEICENTMSSFWIQIHGSNSKRYQIYFFLILEFQNRKAKKQVVSNTACQRKWCRWNVLILDLFTFMFFVFYNLGTSETRSSDLSISWAISTSSNLNSKNSMYIITYTVLVNVNKVKKNSVMAL